jgi:hypothetical protein
MRFGLNRIKICQQQVQVKRKRKRKGTKGGGDTFCVAVEVYKVRGIYKQSLLD